jgi:hypothetical protein
MLDGFDPKRGKRYDRKTAEFSAKKEMKLKI